MEHVAIFEERVSLTPRDLRSHITNIDTILLSKLATRLENKCSRNGFVIADSLKILSRSMGYIEKGRFTGDIVFHIQAEGTVLNPPAGLIIEGVVIRKNKMGIYVSYEDAIRVILPRDLHLGDEVFEAVELGDRVNVMIQKSRFQVNDQYILSVGLFRGLATVKVPAAPVVEAPLVELPQVEVEEAPAVEEQTGGAAAIEFTHSKTDFKELSTFHSAPFTLDEKAWPTVEHYVQAMKYPADPEFQEQIRQTKTAAQARKLGTTKDHPVRDDWPTEQLEVMKKALRAKFEQNTSLRNLLLSTGSKELIEISTTDDFWGRGRKGTGENHLGKLLMELRSSLSAENAS
jgi:ribA/ribD-fused uncharacterized protein